MKEKTLDLYADGIPPNANYINKIIDEYNICGFTCNPTLVKQYLPMTYYDYCKTIIDNSRDFPVSIQVLTSDLNKMVEEANIISSWGKNIYVKIPIVNEYGVTCVPVIRELLWSKKKINITAIFDYTQIAPLFYSVFPNDTECILSVFSGRISDTGKKPNDVIGPIHKLADIYNNAKILWAGARQVTDISHAKKYCHIITLPKSVLDKLDCTKKTFSEYCVETVQMFARDAKNFTL